MRLPIAVAAFVLPLLAACPDAERNLPGRDAGRSGSPDAESFDAAVSVDAGASDVCAPNPCQAPHRGQCVSSNGAPECRCDPGYQDNQGQCEPASVCTPSTCLGHGRCSDTPAGPVCACELGFAGAFCEACDSAGGYYSDGRGGCTLDACTPNPCTDPARQLCTVVSQHAECGCNAGTHDENGACVPDQTCMPLTCSGHGTCTADSSGTSCTCDAGFAGAHCDLCDETLGYHPDGAGGCTRDPCLPNPCTEPLRGVCTDEGGAPRCDCNAGAHLEGDACVADETCAPDSCAQHGTCSVVSGRVECACDQGWTPPSCGACDAAYHPDGAGGCTTDVCLPNPCSAPNQTTCVAAGTTPTCTCDPGAHPDGVGGCTTDPCVPDPCASQNQACRVVASAPECYVPDCDDGNPCTTDALVSGGCRNTRLSDGTSCSTDICRVNELCTAGVCGGGGARACDDGNLCTRDACVSPTGCVFTPDDILLPQDDGVACTVDRCRSGSSEHVPSSAACDDGQYCTGQEICQPGLAADSRGCVTQNLPQPPGPSTPCARYVCSNAQQGFILEQRASGDACDDGIACTSADVCDAAGACAGAPSSACDVPGGMCTPSGDLSATIDIGVAPLTGQVRQNGAVPPLVSTDYSNATIWARARDTGKLHRIAFLDWTRNGSYPNYTRSAASDQIRTTLVPGVYDIVYQRSYDSSADYVWSRVLTPTPDPVVNGYRTLATGVVIPAGGRTLDVDVGATVVTGTITQGGALPPLVSTDYENGTVWARARDTGKLHRIGFLDWTRNGSYPNYTRSSASHRINTLLIPGVYDLLYQRGYQSSSDYVSGQVLSPTADPVVNGYRMVAENVTISGASQVLSVDIGVTQITGLVTQNGAPPPLVSTDYENGTVWARARDTGKLHRIAFLDWTRNGSYPNYTRSAASDQIRTLLVPGAYDILYQRGYQSSSDYVSGQVRSPTPDPVVNGYRQVAENVIIAGASQVLNVDIGATQVTGTVTQGGAAPPLVSTDYENGTVWARARDTGKLHRIAFLDWTRNGSYPSYTRSASSHLINTLLVPGAYDLLYQRGYQSSGDYVSGQVLAPSADPVVNGYRLVAQNVMIGGTSQVVDVDIGVTQVTGAVTQNGAAPPLVSTAYENGTVWARARDTGKLHRIAFLDWTRNGSYPTYTRSAASDQIRTLLVPGAYDILYQRAYQSSGSYVSSQTLSPSADPVVNGYRVVAENVQISGASQVLAVDIQAAAVSGAITMNGATLPMISTDYENGILWLRARDTGVLHRLALMDWTRNGSYPNYTRSAASDHFTSMLVPGAYDLLYQRAYQSSGDYVSSQVLTPTPDPVVNGYRVLAPCVLLAR